MKRRSLFKLAVGAALYIPASRLDFGVPRPSPSIWTPKHDPLVVATPPWDTATNGMWMSLHTSDPGPDGLAHEIDGGSYARGYLDDTGKVRFTGLTMAPIQYTVVHLGDSICVNSVGAPVFLMPEDSLEVTWTPETPLGRSTS